MQFFPATNSTTDVAANLIQAGSNSYTNNNSGNGFDSVLSSFIQDDRYDYSGRPPGFASYGTESGTLDEQTRDQLTKELRKRDVSEENILRLQLLAASGSPVTIGTAFNALSGNSRLTEGLEGDERDTFKLLLGKLGLNADEQEEFLALSDDGDTNAMWKLLSGKLDSLEEHADLTKQEWNTLLKGLDLSSGTTKALKNLFGDQNERSLNGEEIKALLAQVSKEYAGREEASRFAQTQMRGAMEDALRNAKAGERSKPVEDVRGNRLSEQSEAMMHDSVRKNTGSDQLKQDLAQSDEENFESRKDGKSRSERILTTNDSEKPEQSKKTVQQAKEGAADKLLNRIEAAVDMPGQNAATNQVQGQNLNNVAKNYRQEIFSQVEQGLLQNAQNGSQRLTLQLNPAELGQVTVVLSMHQGEMKATIRAENQDSAVVLREQMAELKASLEEQGIKVKELDVQTGLNEQSLAGKWDGPQEHNMLRDANERSRILRLTRIRHEAASESNVAMESAARNTDNSGLHIVA